MRYMRYLNPVRPNKYGQQPAFSLNESSHDMTHFLTDEGGSPLGTGPDDSDLDALARALGLAPVSRSEGSD